MDRAYFYPWKGSNYSKTRVLILSESAYSWLDKGRIVDPSPSHPSSQILHWGIKHFGKPGYYKAMGQAICGTKTPTIDQLRRAWNDYAYTVFVQSTVGLGARKRPTKKQFGAAAPHLKSILEEIRPLKVIVTGKTMWNHHMRCDGPHLCDDLQAYKLLDGTLVWCLAVPHPANRTEGFKWEWVGENIRAFRSIKFPLRD